MYNPLPENITIKSSPIHGLGVFTAIKLKKGTCLGVTHIKHSAFQDGWIRTPLGGFYNHSKIPNCKLETSYQGVHDQRMVTKHLVAIKDIKANQELTCTYTLWKIEEIEDLEKRDWLGL